MNEELGVKNQCCMVICMDIRSIHIRTCEIWDTSFPGGFQYILYEKGIENTHRIYENEPFLSGR